MTQTVAIIDYRCGNLASVQKALLGLGHKPGIVRDPEKLHTFDRAILPVSELQLGHGGDQAAGLPRLDP